MAEFFASGRFIDLILLLMALEGLGLLLLWRVRACGIPPAALVLILASGACLLLAVRAALTDAGWVWVWLFVTVALVVHLADLRQRWQRAHSKTTA